MIRTQLAHDFVRPAACPIFPALLGAAVALSGLTGCSREGNPPSAETNPGGSDKPAASTARYKVGTAFASYYETSPAQGRPPDGEIPPGTMVEVVEDGGSYVRVRWDGKTAWVARSALEPE